MGFPLAFQVADGRGRRLWTRGWVESGDEGGDAVGDGVVESFDVVAVVEEDVGGEGLDGYAEGRVLRVASEETSGKGTETSGVGGVFTFRGEVGDRPKGLEGLRWERRRRRRWW